MDVERWNRIQALFAQALALPPEARERHLRQASAGDESLVVEVLRLLAHDMAGDDKAARLVKAQADELLHAKAVLPPGRRFGAWEAMDHIAFGGMGAVYRARRADGAFEQTAALKVLNPALLGAAGTQRLQAERQILAGLNHPCIARLLDGGTADDGMPFLVMEYVDGLPIDRYCDERRLDTRARLRLFLQVCEAVDHAHRNLVVHRDIKPSNLLVTADGTPKLLDFGISKLLDPAQAGMTVTGERLLTPSHASPEQVTGGPITTATDVYGLGVLLYQLLAGALPFGEAAGSAAQVAQDIVHTAPTRPSAQARNPGLRRELDGDLDNIVLMALRKEPARRYASVQALADDVRAVLEHRPVAARADTLAYRAGKFLRRHRVGVLGAGASLALLVAVVAGYTWRLEQERQRAEEQARTANRVAQFFESLFELADPSQSRRKSLTAEELLDRAAERLEGDLVEEPLVRARLLAAIGRSNTNIGNAAKAEGLLQQAASLYSGPGQREERCAAQLSRADALLALGRLDESSQALLPCASDRPAAELDRTEALHVLRLGADDMAAGRYAIGEERLRRGLAAMTRLDERNSRSVFEATQMLGRGMGWLGRYPEGLALTQEAVDIARRVYGNSSLQLANALSALSWLHRSLDQGEQALAAAQESAAIVAGLFEADHAGNLNARHAVARSLASLGRHDEALAAARENLALAQTNRTAWGATAGLNSTILAVEALMELGQLAAAEAQARQALRSDNPLAPRAGQSGTVYLAALAEQLGTVLEIRGDLRGAEAAFRRGLRHMGDEEGQQQMRTGLRERLAWALLGLSRPAEGDALYRQTIEDARRLYGTQAPDVFGRVLAGYGNWLDAAGRTGEAARWRQEHADLVAQGAPLIEAMQRDMDRWRSAAAGRR